MALRVWLVRHGDRFDYEIGDAAWRAVAQRLMDPPLSDAGRKQAQEVAAELARINAISDRPITKIVTSPFLRCLETANPIAGSLGLPLLVDHSLFEAGHTDCPMPPLEERAAYFPRIELGYQSIFKPDSPEPFPIETLRRLSVTAGSLTERFHGDSCVFVTHAASVVALAACMLKVPVRDIPPASPCCLYCLDRETVDSPWKLSKEYSGSTAHLSAVSIATLPWPNCTSGSLVFLQAGDSASWL